MARTTIPKIALSIFLTGFASSEFFGQGSATIASGEAPVSYDELDTVFASSAPDVIFSNLDRTPGDRYDSNKVQALTIAGRAARVETETWYAVAFTPRVDVQAKVLLAAIGYESGTKMVNLGIYSEDDGTVGDLIPGGQGSTTQIPTLGECCQLAKVTLPEPGVTLQARVRYWLVCSPDDANAPNFLGGWHLSNQAHFATFVPQFGWSNSDGQWPAAEIRGATVQSGLLNGQKKTKENPRRSDTPVRQVTIYNSLNRLSSEPFFYFNGAFVAGNSVSSQDEVWQALPFTPKTDVHAVTLSVAIGYNSGTRLVNIGIYSDADGAVGTLLPGGQASTTDIPDNNECCDLATVTLTGGGVALAAGVQYWLVVSPDNANAPDFYGFWHRSTNAVAAYQQPGHSIPWSNYQGNLFAAEIRGTSP